MNDLYGMCGISRQAHAKAVKRELALKQRDYLYVNFMHEIRRHHPGMGLRKMYEQFNPEGIGRDSFIALGLQEGLRLRSYANPVRTTYSVKSNRYRNLLGGKWFTGVNQVWSSDIFYFQIGEKHHYVVLIMDVYSRRIIGYSAADNMRAENNIKALQMALTLRGIRDYKGQLIHHSDRGSQYISNDYTCLLEDYGIQISMCTDVLENAHIERANGRIKNDYLRRWPVTTPARLTYWLKKAVEGYNNCLHSKIDKMTPMQYESHLKQLEEKERFKMKIFVINNQNSDDPNQLKLGFTL